MDKLSVSKRYMERSLLNIRLIDKICNTTIRGFKDSSKHPLCLKWDWVGHIAGMSDNRWTKLSTEWTPLDKILIALPWNPKQWLMKALSCKEPVKRFNLIPSDKIFISIQLKNLQKFEKNSESHFILI
uniref:Uncharacterized protein n=1 Tax=Megaselia scalaris TaxID=36166 RepID=T1GH41_MEGSC